MSGEHRTSVAIYALRYIVGLLLASWTAVYLCGIALVIAGAFNVVNTDAAIASLGGRLVILATVIHVIAIVVYVCEGEEILMARGFWARLLFVLFIGAETAYWMFRNATEDIIDDRRRHSRSRKPRRSIGQHLEALVTFLVSLSFTVLAWLALLVVCTHFILPDQWAHPVVMGSALLVVVHLALSLALVFTNDSYERNVPTVALSGIAVALITLIDYAEKTGDYTPMLPGANKPEPT